MNLKKTQRGFGIIEFEDLYGNKSSLQKSSLATEDAIWFGTDDAKPQQLVPGKGWQPVEFPEGTSFNTRMHLSQKQVKKLLPFLKRFVKTGEL